MKWCLQGHVSDSSFSIAFCLLPILNSTRVTLTWTGIWYPLICKFITTQGYALKNAHIDSVYCLPKTISHLPCNFIGQEFNLESIHNVLERMTPQDVRVFWSSKSFKGIVDEEEPWYGTHFAQSPIPKEWISSWEESGLDDR